jgi:hypothetical protein
MKITKIDGVSHYKEKEKGVLKGKDILNGKIEKIVKKRYDATIESKIYKEFIKLRKNRIEQNNEKSILKLIKLNIDKNEKEIKTLLLNKFKIKEKNKKYDKYMLDENKLDNDIKIYESVESLYFLIKEIYLGQNNKKWNISKIDLEKIMEEDNNLIMLGYKLKKNITENDYPYLYSDKNGQESTSVYKLLKKLIEENKDRNQDIRKSQEYEKIRKNFEEYKNRKINLLVKSIKNNKINIQYINNEIKSHNNSREENIIKFFKKMIEEKNEPILKDKLKLFKLEVFFDEEFLEEIKKLLDSDDFDKSYNKKISELRGKIFNRIREKIKNNKNRDELENIYFLELKKYIENNLSHKKEKNKNNNNTGEEKSKELYLKFLKKVLFIDDNNRISIEKLKSRIDDNFKNLLIQHVIEYGKIKYYVENDDYIRNIVKNGELKLETKDLEYIKTKETLIRKMVVLVSFAANSYYNLFGSVSEDILGTEVVKNRRTNVIKVKSYIFKEKMLNYFFDSEDFDINKTIEVLESISYSIYNIRNGVGHFNKLVLGKYKKKDINTNKRVEEDLNNNEEIKGYFIQKRGEIEKKIKERFLSNNLQYYYAKERIENYFEVYEFEILKEKIPFAPNFKRIIKKGEDLFNNKKNKKYEYFKNFDKNSAEEKKEFLKTRNFLLKELYYNNFYKEFLSKKEELKKIVIEVKEEKKNRGNNKKSGVSFQNIDDYDTKINISDYIASIHKKEMERVEKYNEEKQKDTAKYIRDFVEEIFLTGFINYLEKDERLHFLKEEFSVLCNSNNNVIDFNVNINEEKIKEFLKENDSKTLNLYLFFNMIDSKRISEFRNELIKYKQFTKKRLDEEKEFLGIKIELYETLIEFVILTREKLDTKKSEETDAWLVDKLYVKEKNECNEYEYKEYEEILKLFVDEKILISKEAPYYATNNKTPIILSNFEKTRKYGTQNLLAKIQSSYKYNEIEKQKIENYNEKKESEKKKKSNIEKLQDLKVELHKKWEQNKITEKEIKKYNDTIKEIREYNYLKNKEELQNVYLLHEILSDLLARNVAFFNKWERDFKFIVIAIKQFLRENDKEKVNEFLNPHKSDGSRDNFSVTNYRSKMKSIINNIHENFMSLLFLNNNLATGGIQMGRNNNFTWGNLRNYIAHFEYLHKEKDTISFIGQANLLIKLFSYDKKVQNHIIKSMKTLLEKYNIEIRFEISNDSEEIFEYKIKYINSKKGKMLGKNNEFEILENEFVRNVKALLEYSK